MIGSTSGDSGHYLCGMVRSDSDGTRNWSCYCESCRRNCAAPLTAFFGVPDGHWPWIGPSPATYASALGVTRHFCARCGTPMAVESAKSPGEIHLYPSSLEDPQTYRPEFHGHHAERLASLSVEYDLPQYPAGGSTGNPE